MERKIFRVKLIMDSLFPGSGIDVSTFEKRLELQKSIYLTQLMHLDLGYRFSWYVHGPYSPDLTETAFTYTSNKSFYDNKMQGYVLTDKGKQKMEIVKGLIEKGQENAATLERERWLELLASIHYLKHITYLQPGVSITIDNIGEKLIDYGKSNFCVTDIRAAWEALEDIGLIDNKLLPEQMLQ